MIPQVENEIEAIRAACERHDVARLEVFGSATDLGSFDASRSDVDFIVAYAPGADLGPWLRKYFELRDALTEIVGRPVDLVMEGAMRDARFQREAARTRRVIYVDEDRQAAGGHP